MSNQMPERIPGGGVDLSHLAARHQQQAAQAQAQAQGGAAGAPGAAAPTGGMPQTVDVPSLVVDATDATFEQVAQLSSVVPVVIHLGSARSEASQAIGGLLEQIVRELDGRAMLAMVDVDSNPGIAQAFGVQSIPSAAALVAGRPVPLFQGVMAEPQVRELFDQLMPLAAENGVAGRVAAPDMGGEAPAPYEKPIPEAHRPALDAAEAGDFAKSIEEWEKVLLKAPADHEARAALVQMKLLDRLSGRSADEIRMAAGQAPTDVDAQLAVADLDVSGGHIEDAFLRLLDLFAAQPADERGRVQDRLLELFEVVGVSDPRVIAARGRLANLLY